MYNVNMAHKERDDLIRKMRGEGKTLQEIGDFFNISRERVRQVLDKDYKSKRKALSPTA